MSSWEDRVFVNVSFGVTPEKTQNISQADSTFSIYQETATIGYSTPHTVTSGGMLTDLTIGVRAKNHLGVAFSYWTAPSTTADATLTASIPDPVFFDKPRSVSSTVTGLEHKERWMAVLAVYQIPVNEKFDIMLLAGPAIVSVDQDVSSFTTPPTEGPSGPQIPMTRTTLSKTVWTYRVGADARYMFTKNVGAGVFLGVSTAKANLQPDLSLELGGFQVAGGLRVRF